MTLRSVQAEMGASSISCSTGVGARLAGCGNHFDVHRVLDFISYDLAILSGEFLGTLDALRLPIRPINIIAVLQGQ